MGYIRKRYDSSWIVVVELGRDPITGKRRRKQVAVRGSRRDAERVLRQLEAEAQGGLDASRANFRVTDLLARWLEHVRLHRERRTYDDYAMWAERIGEALGHVPLDKLRTSHIQAFYDALQTGRRRDGRPGTLSPNTVHKAHRALRAALSFGVRMGWLASNPAVNATLPRRQEGEKTILTPEQTQTLLASLLGSRWYPMFYLAAHTGLRVGELCGLWWADIDWDEPAIHVRRALKEVRPDRGERGRNRLVLGDVKSHERRVVYLRDQDAEVLAAHRSRQEVQRTMSGRWPHPEHVFTTPTGELIRPSVPNQILRKACLKAGVPVVTMHGLRHGHGSHLLAAGWDLAAVSERLGHRDVAFTARVYVHAIPGLQKRYIRDGKT